MIKICIQFLTCFLFLTAAGAAPTTPGREKTELQELSAHVEKMEHDLELHKEIVRVSIESSDKRVADLGILATMQGTQTSWVGSLVGMAGVAITIIVAIAGTLTYFNVSARAKDAAQNEAQKWLEANEGSLHKKIADLDARVDDAIANIAAHEKAVEEMSMRATSSMRDDEKSIKAAADQIMQRAASVKPQNPQSASVRSAIVQKASEELKHKPESDFIANDYYIRGVSLYSNGKYEGALDSFNAALRNPAELTESDYVRYLFSKALTLSKMGDIKQALSIYEELDQKFSSSLVEDIRETLCESLLNRIRILSKDADPLSAIELADELIARYADVTALRMREMVLQASYRKATLLSKAGDREKSLDAYSIIFDRYREEESETIHNNLVAASLSRAALFVVLNDVERAIHEFDSIITRFYDSSSIVLRRLVVRAMIGKGIALRTSGKPEDALAIYNKLDKEFSKESDSEIRLQVAKGLSVKLNALADSSMHAEIEETVDEIVRRYSNDSDERLRIVAVKVLIDKAERFSTAGASSDELAVYDTLVRQYGRDPSIAIRTIIGDSQNSSGYARLMLAKKYWIDTDRRKHLLEEARQILEDALLTCSDDVRDMVLGNLGYVAYLVGDLDNAEKLTLQALSAGGERILRGQRNDAEIDQLENDGAYLEMLNRLSQLKGLKPPVEDDDFI